MAALPSTLPLLLPLALLWGTGGSLPTSTSLSTGNHHHSSSSPPAPLLLAPRTASQLCAPRGPHPFIN